MPKLSPEIVRDHRWEFFGAHAFPLYISIYPPFYTHGFSERFGTPVDILNTYEGKRVHWFMRADQLIALAKKVLPIFLSEQWGYYDTWQRENEPFLAINKKLIAMDLGALSDDELVRLIRTYREVFGVPFVTNNVIEGLSYYFQHHLSELLEAEGVPKERCAELIDAYGQAARPSYLKRCAEAYRAAQTDEERSAIVREYYYIYNDYAGVVPATEDAIKDLAQSTPHNGAAQAATPGISKGAQALLNVVQITATMQDVRKGDFLLMVDAAHRFAQERARRTGISMDLVRYATWAEVEEGALVEEELKKRERSALYWTVEGVTTLTGEEAQAIIDATNAHVFATGENAQEVKGVCASKGLVRGRAIVIFDPAEFHKVQPGDILFTMMTRPEFLPVMHRAAAFVCDEGGLTSHAAIVAREMKKPCVVGTRIGTRIFKDGDTVEVDASAGIVRVVEKSIL